MKLYRLSSLILVAALIAGGILYFPFLHSINNSADITSHATSMSNPADLNSTKTEIVIPARDSSPTAPALKAGYACVMDAESGRILYEKKANQKAPMASTTKIMTLLLALESGKLEEPVIASAYAASMPKVHLGMQKGYQYKLKDLLYSLMLESHNDTAVAIAEHLAGSVNAFAEQMNRKAAKLKLTKTHFVTPNGLDADGHYSTAADMCRLASYAMQNKKFLEIIRTKNYSFTTLDGKHQYSLSNKDAFLSYYDGALGIKTGFTGKAGYCFVGAARRSDVTLVSCVLACGWPPNKSFKWIDTSKLMDYGFNNFSKKTISPPDISHIHIPVIKGKKEYVTCCLPESLTLLTGAGDTLKINCSLPKSLCAPIRQNNPVGTVSYYINDKLFQSDEIFLSESIEKSDISDTIRNVLHLWMKAFGSSS